MDLAELLTGMLNQTCPSSTYINDEGKEVKVAKIDLHCTEYEIHWTSQFPEVTVLQAIPRSI